MSSYLITGGTGSLGRALTQRLLSLPGTRRVVIFSRDELKQSEMAKEFGDDQRLRFFLGDVRDCPRMWLALQDVESVIHAAALKRVDALEYNPSEAVKTNIIGTDNVIQAVLRSKVKRMLFISTDKACAPITLYGATKLAAEKLAVAANSYSGADGPRFSCVRYGNVAGSRGSVIPFWQECVRQGKPLPVTDWQMTRFHIRMDQAVDLVMTALERMEGREVFVPKLPAFKVIDLARAIGGPNWGQEVIGLRGAEKLHESLISADELRADCGGYYIVGQGDPGPEYSSNNGDCRLTIEGLRIELEVLAAKARAA